MENGTVTLVLQNFTERTLYPRAPRPFHSVRAIVSNFPQVVETRHGNGNAGSFAYNGDESSMYGAALYQTPDPTKIMFLFFMNQHYNDSKRVTNLAKVGFLDHSVDITTQLLWDIYLNQGQEFGQNAEHEYKDKDGKLVTLRLNGEIDLNAFNAKATYNLSFKHD